MFRIWAHRVVLLSPQSQIIVAVILVWLWNYHEDDFQRAFAKSGRIDVDPTCKWLVQAAVDASVRALTMYIKETAAARANKADAPAKNVSTERSAEGAGSAEIVAASVVGKALTTQSCMNAEVVSNVNEWFVVLLRTNEISSNSRVSYNDRIVPYLTFMPWSSSLTNAVCVRCILGLRNECFWRI